MKTRSKKIRLAVALLMSFAIVAAIFRTAMGRGPAQIITLSDGSRYRFAGTTWGTNHSQPRLLAHMVDHLPNRWSAYVRTKLGLRVGLDAPLATPSPILLVWFHKVGTPDKVPYVAGLFVTRMVLADENGVLAGIPSRGMMTVSAPNWLMVPFHQVPRRSRLLECQFFNWPASDVSGDTAKLACVKFPNPLFGQYPQWQPKAMPMETNAGDLRVQLKSLGNRLARIGDDKDCKTIFSLAINPARPNEKWGVDAIELSDATGNSLTLKGFTYPEPDGLYSIRGRLWHDELALRLKLGLTRISGYSAPGSAVPEERFVEFLAKPTEWK